MSWEPLEAVRNELLKQPLYKACSGSVLHPANWTQQLESIKWADGYGLLHYIKYASPNPPAINLEISSYAVQQNSGDYLISDDEREMFVASRIIYKSTYPQLPIIEELEKLGIECFNKHPDGSDDDVVIVLWWGKKVLIRNTDLEPLKAILSDPNSDISKFEPLIKAAMK